MKSHLQSTQLRLVKCLSPEWVLWRHRGPSRTACADVIILGQSSTQKSSQVVRSYTKTHTHVVNQPNHSNRDHPLPDKNQPIIHIIWFSLLDQGLLLLTPPSQGLWGADLISTLAPPVPISSWKDICQVVKTQWELLLQRQGTASINSDRAYLLAGEHCRDSDETSDTASNCSLCPWEPQSLLMQLWCCQRQRMLLLTSVGERRPLVTTGNCFLPQQMAHNPVHSPCLQMHHLVIWPESM